MLLGVARRVSRGQRAMEADQLWARLLWAVTSAEHGFPLLPL